MVVEFTREIAQALSGAFPDGEVEFLPRAVSGNRALALPYIEARDVMRRLDSVVGPAGWSFDFDVLSDDGRRVKGRLTVLGVTKCDAGEASTEDETLKSAVSDALKRCAVHFGIGRYLYYIPRFWASYDSQKRQWTDRPCIPAEDLDRALQCCGAEASRPIPLSALIGSPQHTASSPRMETEPAPAMGVADSPEEHGANGAPRKSRGGAAGTWAVGSKGRTGAEEPSRNLSCSRAECGKGVTKGQYELSRRAFGRALCPECQREHTRAA